MRPPRSIPPELVAAASAKEGSIETDPIEILSQRASFAEIERIGTEEWITLYFYESYPHGSRCYHCALIPKRQVERAVKDAGWDLMIGNGLPGFSQSHVSGKMKTRYERFSSLPIEPLILRRSFHGLKPDQFDILEEFRLFHNLYHDRRNEKYVHIDDRGEEDVVVEVSPKCVRAKLRYVRQFMAARGLHLAIFFDHIARAAIEVEKAREKIETFQIANNDLRLSFGIGDLSSGETCSRIVGKKLIGPLALKECGIWPYESTQIRQYAEFIIDVEPNGKQVTNTCDDEALANYFGKNPSEPHFLTPVWFRREVLRKYYDHPEKFTVEDGYLRCGGLWGLRMDNDLADHVVVYLGDLGSLAYEEQLYWKSFNIPPVSNQTSATNYKRSFLAQFADPTSDDLVLKQRLVSLQEAWTAQYGWQLFRQLHDDDAHVLKQLRVPLSDSLAEFDHQMVLLTKLLIDSLNDAELARELGGANLDEKSIAKLERFLKARKYPATDRDIQLLRLLQAARSTGAAHRKGEKYAKISAQLGLKDKPAPAVFRELLARVNAMLADLEGFFIPPEG